MSNYAEIIGNHLYNCTENGLWKRPITVSGGYASFGEPAHIVDNGTNVDGVCKWGNFVCYSSGGKVFIENSNQKPFDFSGYSADRVRSVLGTLFFRIKKSGGQAKYYLYNGNPVENLDFNKLLAVRTSASVNITPHQGIVDGSDDLRISYSSDGGVFYINTDNAVFYWGASDRQTLLSNRGTYQTISLPNVRYAFKQRAWDVTIREYLKTGDDYSGTVVITDAGSYINDSLDGEKSISKLAYLDSDAVKAFQTNFGVCFQKQNKEIYVNQNGFSSVRLDLGENYPKFVSGLQKIGDSVILRASEEDGGDEFYSYLWNGDWVSVQPDGNYADSLQEILINGEKATVATVENQAYRTIYAKTRLLSFDYALPIPQISDSIPERVVKTANSASFVYKTEDGYHYLGNPDGSQTYVYDNCVNLVPIRGTDIVLVTEKQSNEEKNRYYLDENGQRTQLSVGLEDSMFLAYGVNGKKAVFSIDRIETFDRYAVINVFKTASDRMTSPVYGAVRSDSGFWLINGKDGLTKYEKGIFESVPFFGDAKTLVRHEYGDPGETFVASDGGTLRASNDLNSWNELVSFENDTINDVNIRNRTEYYVATDSGLFKTEYSYELVNDFDTRSEYEMRKFVSGLSDSLDTCYRVDLEKHLNDFHLSSDPITFLNEKTLSVNFETVPETWCERGESGKEFLVRNDLVQNIDFGDNSSGSLGVTA